jgi:hypothetical protein
VSAGAAEGLSWLPGPYEFWTPREGVTFSLLAVRFEVGLSTRDISEPPYAVVRPTVRIYVPPERKPGRPPYWDFTSTGLAQRLLAVWRMAQDRAFEREADVGVAMLEATSPARGRGVPLRLTRRFVDGEHMYELELGPGA